MSLDTWVSIAALAAVAITLFGQARSTRTELKRDIAELRAEVKSEIAETRRELWEAVHSSESGVRADLKHLDDRVYALAAGLKPEIERTSSSDRRPA